MKEVMTMTQHIAKDPTATHATRTLCGRIMVPGMNISGDTCKTCAKAGAKLEAERQQLMKETDAWVSPESMLNPPEELDLSPSRSDEYAPDASEPVPSDYRDEPVTEPRPELMKRIRALSSRPRTPDMEQTDVDGPMRFRAGRFGKHKRSAHRYGR